LFNYYLSANQSQGTDFFSLYSKLTVTLVLPGDYNNDGLVSAADYTVWRKMRGQDVAVGSGADGNFDGVVDDRDFEVWRKHYAPTAGSGAVVAGEIPEPDGRMMILMGIAGIFWRRPWRIAVVFTDSRPTPPHQL
jgi:hypothetical protein